MFIFGARNFPSRCIWHEKPAPESGVDLWRWFLQRVSMGIKWTEETKLKIGTEVKPSWLLWYSAMEKECTQRFTQFYEWKRNTAVRCRDAVCALQMLTLIVRLTWWKSIPVNRIANRMRRSSRRFGAADVSFIHKFHRDRFLPPR